MLKFNVCHFGALKKMAAQNVNFVACGQVGFPRFLLLVADEAVSHQRKRRYIAVSAT